MTADLGFRITELSAGIIDFAFTRPAPTEADSTAVAQAVVDKLSKVFSTFGPNEALVLVQLYDDDSPVSAEAMRLYSTLLRDPHIMRMAIFGGSRRYRYLAKAVMPFTPHQTIKVFDTKGEAMRWLINN